MDFNDVLDEEVGAFVFLGIISAVSSTDAYDKVLKVKRTVINRAPLMTAWATIVAERLGFEREEALSIGRCRDTLFMVDHHQISFSSLQDQCTRR